MSYIYNTDNTHLQPAWIDAMPDKHNASFYDVKKQVSNAPMTIQKVVDSRSEATVMITVTGSEAISPGLRTSRGQSIMISASQASKLQLSATALGERVM